MLPAITPSGSLDVARVDKVGVNLELRKFKHTNGSANYPALFSIPGDKRLSAMAEKDLGGTIKMISVALTLCFESMNLSRPMQAFQILDLAEAIVDSSGEEDKPAFEDLMLFLQKLTRGDYGPLYESIDIPKFMSLFSKYRDERWEEGIRMRDKKHEEYKEMGDQQSFDRAYRKPDNAFDQHLHDFNTKLQAKNDEIKRLREENKRKSK